MNSNFVKKIDFRYGSINIPLQDEIIGKSLEIYGEWAQHELDMLRYFISSGDVVIDVGAYIGSHTIAFANFVENNGRVYSIEAQPSIFDILKTNISINKLNNVTLFNKACSGKNLSEELYIENGPDKNPGSRVIQKKKGDNSLKRIETISLDMLNIPKCDVIKIDVEGMELKVIEGASDLIKKHHPFVYLEVLSVDNAINCLNAMKQNSYTAFLHVPPHFNKNNFNKVPDEIFPFAREANILFLPPNKCATFDHHDIDDLALIKNVDDLVLGLLKKPQYKHEILANTTPANIWGNNFWKNEYETETELANNANSILKMRSEIARVKKLSNAQTLKLAEDKNKLTQLIKASEKNIKSLAQQLDVSEKNAKSLARQLDVSEKNAESLVRQLDVSEKNAESLVRQLDVSEKNAKSLVRQLDVIKDKNVHLIKINKDTIKAQKISSIEKESILKEKIVELNTEVANKDKIIQQIRESKFRQISELNMTIEKLLGDKILMRNRVALLESNSQFYHKITIDLIRSRLFKQWVFKSPLRLIKRIASFMIKPAIIANYFRSYRLIKYSGMFDQDYYKYKYPEISIYYYDLLRHFVNIGWHEGRNPNALFDIKYYQQKYNITEKNPLLHYIKEGHKSNFIINRESDEEYQLLKNSTLFDEVFYISHNKVALQNNTDPILHYLSIGWKEGLQPSAAFNNDFYINTYPDVKDSNICPLIHYLIYGHSEKRKKNITDQNTPTHCEHHLVPTQDETRSDQHPLGHNIVCIDNIKNIRNGLSFSSSNFTKDDVLISQDLLDTFLQDLPLKDAVGCVISLSHDKYIENTGGIQLCILDEQKAYNRSNWIYFHISPYIVQSNFIDYPTEVVYYNIIINGKFVGVTDDCVKILQIFLKYKLDIEVIIHALHGFSSHFISTLIDELKPIEKYFWTHDYFSLCAGYTLLRNNISYCNSPPSNSGACKICAFGESRKKHLTAIGNIFSKHTFTIISPSETALNIWKSRTNYKCKDYFILPHRFIGKESTNNSKPYKKTTFNVAFLGHPAIHKGWLVYKKLVSVFSGNSAFKFYHLGANGKSDANIKYISVNSTKKDPEQMLRSLIENEIDIAVLWSVWPETYNIVAMEAVAAGVYILTSQSGGNIVNIVENNSIGHIYKSETDLFKSFKNNLSDTDFHLKHKNGISKYDLIHSDVTFELRKKK